MNITMSRSWQAAIAIALAAGLCSSTLTATPAHANEAVVPAEYTSPIGEFVPEARDLASGLELLDRVPESVLLEGQPAFEAWVAAQPLESLPSGRASILQCSGAIALLIASTAFPVAKILKIKRLISSLGGVAKAVRIMWGASFSWEKIRALGGAAAALGAELVGIAAVKRGCFR